MANVIISLVLLIGAINSLLLHRRLRRLEQTVTVQKSAISTQAGMMSTLQSSVTALNCTIQQGA